jgi:hypothetical protein
MKLEQAILPNPCLEEEEDLLLSWGLSIMKFSQAISQVKWLNREKTNISKTISVLVLRMLIWISTVQPLDPADSLREIHYINYCRF